MQTLTSMRFYSKMAAFMASLPKLSDVQRLSKHVVRILGQNASPYTLQGTNSYVLGTGPRRILMDTTSPAAHTDGVGTPKYLENLRGFLASENAKIGEIILTHRHYDHVGAIKEVMQDSSMVHQDGPIRCSKYPGIKQNEFTTAITWHYMSDGDQFRAEGVTLSALYTPGHTDDHVGFILEEENALFTGDHILGHGSTFAEQLDRYLVSLARVQTLNQSRRFGRLYPSHGDIIHGETAVQQKIEEYVRHRSSRIEQVLVLMRQATAKEGFTVEEVVKRFYPKLDGALAYGATNNVLQTLQLLVTRGELESFETSSQGDSVTRWRVKQSSAGKAA